MKTKISILLAAFLVTFGMSSCKSGKELVETDKSTEIIVPLSGKEFQSSKSHYRSKSSGKSVNMATAKKIAMNNAKAEVAGLINTTIKSVTDQYTNQRTKGTQDDFENKFESMTREVVNQKLFDIAIIGEKIYKQKDGSYEYWVAIEIPKDAILEGINNQMSKETKLQIDYDKKKFEEIYNQEMEEMEN